MSISGSLVYPRAGDFRLLVTLQMPDPASARDSVGERVTTWLDVASVYAKVEPLTSAQKFIAAQNQSDISHTVTIRYDSTIADIDSRWRVKLGTRYLVLNGDPINVEERNIILELPCVEGLSNE